MKKLAATLAIAAGLVVAAPAEAHCPNACYTGWYGFTAGKLGVKASGPVTDAMIRTAVQNSLNRHNSAEYLITTATWSGSRTSSTSGYATHFADYGWRYTPARITWLPSMYIHQCQADWENHPAYDVRVRCIKHMNAAH